MTSVKQVKAYAKIAVECIADRQKKYAPEANMYHSGLSNTPYAQTAYKHYTELGEAIKFFEDMAHGKSGLPLFDK